MEIRICSLCPATRKQPRLTRFYAAIERWVCQICYRGLTALGFCELCNHPRPLTRERKTGLRRCEQCRHRNERKNVPLPHSTCPDCSRPDLKLPRKNEAGVAICNRCYWQGRPLRRKMGVCSICLPKEPKLLNRRLSNGELVCDSCWKWSAPKRRCTECGLYKKWLRRYRRRKGRRFKGRLVCQPCLRRLNPPPPIICRDCGLEKQPKSAGRCAGCATRHWRRIHPSA